jgi:hypothetical protein
MKFPTGAERRVAQRSWPEKLAPADFYDRFYRPEALSDTQRRHMEDWHGEA